jgi:fatty acid desaturase
MGFYWCGVAVILNVDNLLIKALVSFFIGISLASLTFFLHDLFHDSIIKSRLFAYFTGLSIGILNLFAPIFWHRVHNFHHARTGNVDDPDRSYIISEMPKNTLEKLIYKTRMSNEAYNPVLSLLFMSTGFFWYFLNTMMSMFVGVKNQYAKKYNRTQELFKKNADKAIVVFELVTIFSFQIFLYSYLAKGNFLNYMFIGIIPIAISHFIAMSYIHTNHFLSPLTGEIDDPLINSLSLKNSKFIDKIFFNFSHHVEHHLFPAMSSSHYPEVRKLLLKLYPERFQLMPYVDAIKMLFKTPRIYSDSTHLITLDGTKKINCLLPAK